MAKEFEGRIADLLAAYGSDVARWPASERELWTKFDPELRARLAAQHEALDRLIVRARDAADQAAPSEALMARIMTAARTGTVAGAGVGPVNEAPSGDVVSLASPRRTLSVGDAGLVSKREWSAAAALMAASLVLGVFFGSTEPVRSTAAQIGNLAGLNITTQAVQTSALEDALQIQDDEDFI